MQILQWHRSPFCATTLLDLTSPCNKREALCKGTVDALLIQPKWLEESSSPPFFCGLFHLGVPRYTGIGVLEKPGPREILKPSSVSFLLEGTFNVQNVPEDGKKKYCQLFLHTQKTRKVNPQKTRYSELEMEKCIVVFEFFAPFRCLKVLDSDDDVVAPSTPPRGMDRMVKGDQQLAFSFRKSSSFSL